MTSPGYTAMGSSTGNRKWTYQINIGTFAAKNYQVMEAVTNSQFNPDNPNWVDNTDQAGKGFKSQNKTGADWSGSLTIERKVGQSDPTTYGPVQEFVRLASIGRFGPSNTIEIRVFEYDPNDPNGIYTPRIEAYHGFCGVSWQPSGGDMMADDAVQVAFVSQGALDVITHPYPKTPVVPTVTAVSPNTGLVRGGGDLVNITGSGFATTVANSGVKFGTVNSPKWIVESDTLIVAQTPAQTGAGPVQVVVTNSTGPSTNNVTATYL